MKKLTKVNECVNESVNEGVDKLNNIHEKKDIKKKKKEIETDIKKKEEEENCLVCAGNIEILSSSKCKHGVCHVCEYKNRFLYKKKTCMICRSENEVVFFTQKEFLFSDQDEFKLEGKYVDRKLGIVFENQNIQEETLRLLENCCQICETIFSTFNKLAVHVKSKHKLLYCYVCYKNKKKFVKELTLYKPEELLSHQSVQKDSFFHGHPMCKFCLGGRFYSNEELLLHVRDLHERCHICDKNEFILNGYFKNYEHVFTHFKTKHHVCESPECLEKKFVVFKQDVDLKLHDLKEHNKNTKKGKLILGCEPKYNQIKTEKQKQKQKQSKDENEGEDNDKVRRFLERAKLYLKHNYNNIQNFLELNEQYQNKNFTSAKLFQKYKLLFKDQSDSDILILIQDFAESLTTSNPLYNDLINLSNTLYSKMNFDSKFPVLGKSNFISNDFWVEKKSKTNKNILSCDDSFPVLKKKITHTVTPVQNNNYSSTNDYKLLTNDKKECESKPFDLSDYLNSIISLSSESRNNFLIKVPRTKSKK